MKKVNYAETIQNALLESLEGVEDGLSFPELFKAAHPTMQDQAGQGGGEEMMRLRSYEQLQILVQRGQVSRHRSSGTAIYTPGE